MEGKVFTRPDGAEILVNATDCDIFLGDDESEKWFFAFSMRELTNLDRGKRASLEVAGQHGNERALFEEHRRVTQALVVSHSKSEIAVTPAIFCSGVEDRVTRPVVEQILEESEPARTIVSELKSAGLFSFIEELKTSGAQKTSGTSLKFLLASLVMSMTGVKCLNDITSEAFSEWLQYFRLPDATRWREDLWNSNRAIAFQCLREITYAYARYTGNSEVAPLARQKRNGQGTNLYLEQVLNTNKEHLLPWVTFFRKWRSIRPTVDSNYNQLLLNIVKWLLSNFPEAEILDVGGILARSDREPDFGAWLSGQIRGAPGSPEIAARLRYAKRFFEWLSVQLRLQGDARTLYPWVSEEILAETKRSTKPKPTESTSRPLPMRYYRMTEDILREGEAGWPGQCSLCQEVVVQPDGTAREMYCPVLPTMFLAMFRLPARVIQIKLLDSGEGDTRSFNPDKNRWEPNQASTAGYWLDSLRIREERGYAKEFVVPDGKNFTGFILNTNKHQRNQTIPWQDESLHQLLYGLKTWQQANNPIIKPVGPETYLDNSEGVEEGKLADYPEIFPLFRLPGDARVSKIGSPPTGRQTYEFWQYVMAELERRVNLEKPDSEKVVIVKRDKKGYPTAALYNPHGLRVAGLTLMHQCGVPFEMLSKYGAGHMNIWATLYYLKFSPQFINEQLSEAARNRDSTMAQALIRDLKDLTIETAQLRAASMTPEALEHFRGPNADPMFWSDVSIGLCPGEGVWCHKGGEILRKQSKDGQPNHTYGPVEGGCRNCVMCRFFVTGPAWITPLWLHGNKLARAFSLKYKRVDGLSAELQEIQTGDSTSATKARADQLTSEINALTLEQEVLGKSIHAAFTLLQASLEIDARKADNSAPDHRTDLVAASTSAIELASTTEFAVTSTLTKGSRIYPILRDEQTEATRNHFLETIMWRNGLTPLSLSPLPDEVKRRGQDAMADFLMQRTNFEEQEALISGAESLGTLGIESRLLATVGEAVQIPIELLASRNKLLANSGARA